MVSISRVYHPLFVSRLDTCAWCLTNPPGPLIPGTPRSLKLGDAPIPPCQIFGLFELAVAGDFASLKPNAAFGVCGGMLEV